LFKVRVKACFVCSSLTPAPHPLNDPASQERFTPWDGYLGGEDQTMRPMGLILLPEFRPPAGLVPETDLKDLGLPATPKVPRFDIVYR